MWGGAYSKNAEMKIGLVVSAVSAVSADRCEATEPLLITCDGGLKSERAVFAYTRRTSYLLEW